MNNRTGYFWGDRFKNVLIEKGEALINCLAYIDLNPVRAKIVKRPEDYRWSGIGYQINHLTPSCPSCLILRKIRKYFNGGMLFFSFF